VRPQATPDRIEQRVSSQVEQRPEAVPDPKVDLDGAASTEAGQGRAHRVEDRRLPGTVEAVESGDAAVEAQLTSLERWRSDQRATDDIKGGRSIQIGHVSTL
jgi:hypothetical protein